MKLIYSTMCFFYVFWLEKREEKVLLSQKGALIDRNFQRVPYTANVYRVLQGLYSEIGVQGFQIYGDCIYTPNPCNFEIPHSYFHCNICREFDFTGILQGLPTLDVGKLCNDINFRRYTCKICRDSL